MKTKMIIFILLFCFMSAYAQMSFTHFPLQKGNKWFFSWMPTIDNSVRTILEATEDTLMSNGKIYTRIDRLDKNDTVWTRINGYYFLREDNNILYNFPNDTLLNYNWNDSTLWSELPEGFTEISIENSIVFDESRLTYFLYIYNPYEYISYTDSIGFNALHALEWRDWTEISRYLVGGIIDNKTYGDIITNIKSYEKQFLSNYQLLQNYPNPFNPSTKINYLIPQTNFVTIKVFDMLGKEIVILVNEEKPAGSYEVEFDASNLSSGVYFYRMQAGSFTNTKKFILIR